MVFAGEVDDLRTRCRPRVVRPLFSRVAIALRLFAEATADHSRLKIQTLLQMAVVLTLRCIFTCDQDWAELRPVCEVVAPSDMETRGDVTLPHTAVMLLILSNYSRVAHSVIPRACWILYHHAASTLNLDSVPSLAVAGADLWLVHH